MKEYDSNSPLIHIHVPKTGGTSVKELYKEWFGDKLFFHYYNEPEGKMPRKYNLSALHTIESPVCLYGHFNRTRGFGIEHYYPEVDQFIAILRDPFERAVSAYFFKLNNRSDWKDQSKIPTGELSEHILKEKVSILDHFPQEVTTNNYQDIIETQFIEIGITEHLDESMQRIASKLNYYYKPGSLPTLNATQRDQRIPKQLREKYIEERQLDYAVYNYVLAKYT